jgi:YD repeat-containing protein
MNGKEHRYALRKPHALIKDGDVLYRYDACGNMISGAGRSIGYDDENRPVEITDNSVTTQFIYDGDGKRVKKIINNGVAAITTIHVEDLFEKEVIQ